MIPTLLRDRPVFKVTIHILVWILLLFIPYLLSHGDQYEFKRSMQFSWLPMIFYALLFYFNYLYCIDHILFKKKTTLYIVINLVAVIILAFVSHELKSMLMHMSPPRVPRAPGPMHVRPPMSLFLYRDSISLLIPVIVAFAVKMSERWSRMETEKAEKEKEHLNSELIHLKYQLQPHFFFNSLFNIYSLIERSPELAREAVHSLSKLMRYMLYDAESRQVTLKEEIEFITLYINLMKLRITAKTKVHTDFPTTEDHHSIAPLLFISLIENAFKHGVSATQPSEIYFKLAINNNELIFIAENFNFPKSQQDKSGSGIGLNNLKKRLELLYPGQYTYKAGVDGNTYSAYLNINLNGAVKHENN